jgi:hypothetical protein
MHLSIKTYLTLLPICFFLYTASLLGQSAGFHLQTEQGISALNNFNMTRNKGAFGGYATSLGGTYYFPSGFYLKANVQRLSAQLEFRNDDFDLSSIDTFAIDIVQANGSTRSREYRIAYGAGISTNWKKVHFALDLAHSIEFHQRAESTVNLETGFFFDAGSFALSQYGASFLYANESWRLINNSTHQLQLTGSILVELSPQMGIGLFYRTDLLTRWVELQLEHRQHQAEPVVIERRDARQAMTGLRLTYQIGGFKN